jgi:UDP-N-acetylglucosamine 2-epimerase (non-hydrolysing)
MKVAAVVEAMAPHPELDPVVVHTGQHYDPRLSQVMFDELGLPRPKFNLGVGSGGHAQQTAEILSRFEPVLLEERPDLVLVVGDVNSTVACSLAAVKLGIPVAHVEAGLRSFDRTMPEEINRVVTDAIAHLLFVSERSGVENLRREGVPEECVFFVGNLMIDTLLRHREAAASSDILDRFGLWPDRYGVLTLHRAGTSTIPPCSGRCSRRWTASARACRSFSRFTRARAIDWRRSRPRACDRAAAGT